MNKEAYLESLLTLPMISGPKISRDQNLAAWTWFRMGPAADVFFAPCDGSSPPTRLSETAENTYLVSWVPDSTAVIVAEDKAGNERYQLFLINVKEPLVMRPITEEDPDFFLRGGALHPDRKTLLYGANYDFDSRQEIEPTWIYRHDLSTGERKALAKPEKAGYIVPQMSTDGTLVIYPRKDRHPAGRQIWLVDLEGQGDRELINLGDEVKAFASWFPVSHQLLVMGETDTHRKLGVIRLPDDQIDWLIDDPDRNIENAFVPYGSQQIVVIEVQEARIRACLLDPTTKKETKISTEAGNLIPLGPNSAEEWVGMYYSSNHPEELTRFSISKPAIDRELTISRIWDQTPLTREDFTTAQDYFWESEDGLRIQGYLYQPLGEPKGTILSIHGGPTWHSQDWINNQIQFFTRNGYVVLDPNYRGSTGFGLEFQEAIKVDGWGGMEQVDIRTGIEQLIRDGIARPGKVGITGTSYGGYSAWWAITHFPTDLIQAAAPICGMTDLVVDYESTRPDLRPLSEEMIGGSPSEIPEKYRERSPINFLANIQGKLFIVQGGRDPNVTPENVRVVRDALDRENKPYQLLKFDDEGHGISKPKNQRTLYLALLDFFEEALQSP